MDYLKQAIFIFLVVAGLATAAETFTDKRDFGSDGLLWQYESQAWTQNKSVNWIHSLAGFENSASVTKATLPIDAAGVDDPWWSKKSGSHPNPFAMSNGQKFGLLNKSAKGYEVCNSEDILDSAANYSDFKNRSRWNSHSAGYYSRRNGPKYGGGVRVDDAKYPDFCDPSPVPPAAVPSPSAILLAGLGTAFVGVLRNRKIKLA